MLSIALFLVFVYATFCIFFLFLLVSGLVATCIVALLGLFNLACTDNKCIYNSSINVGEKDLNKLTKKMLDDRKSKPPKTDDQTLLDLFISVSDDEEVQLADALEFAMSGQYCLEYCKIYLPIYLKLWLLHA